RRLPSRAAARTAGQASFAPPTSAISMGFHTFIHDLLGTGASAWCSLPAQTDRKKAEYSTRRSRASSELGTDHGVERLPIDLAARRQRHRLEPHDPAGHLER